jgi:DNA-binding transcriptional MerR regulator
MIIRELAQQTGVPAKTIRYYESIGLLPRPNRAKNNYRQYRPLDVERVRFIASARSLGLSLDDIAEILAARDNGIAPCQRVLDTIAQRLDEIDRRIADLLTLRDSLRQLHAEGAALPLDDVGGERCICYLLKTYRDTGQIIIQKGERFND